MLLRILPSLIILVTLLSCGWERRGGNRSRLANQISSPAQELVQHIPAPLLVDHTGQSSSGFAINLLGAGNNLGPKLSASYSSQQRGSSELGYGWSLQAVSVISRCAEHRFFDARYGQADYADDNPLCLDGKRLVLVRGQALTAGAEYRLVYEDFTSVRYEADGSFAVWKKDGEIAFYGLQAGHRLVSATEGKTFQWLLSRIRDRKANVVDYIYAGHEDQEQPRLIEIRYGGNETMSAPASRRVVFDYEASPEGEQITHIPGVRLYSRQRLSSVRVYGSSSEVWRYRFSYQRMPGSGLSLLQSVEVCYPSGACGRPTRFQYEGLEPKIEDGGATILRELGLSSITQNEGTRFVGDLNRDGFTDVAAIVTRREGIQLLTAYGRAEGLSEAVVRQPFELPQQWSARDHPVMVGELDGDGYPDLITLINVRGSTDTEGSSGIWVARGSAAGFVGGGFVSPEFGIGWKFDEEDLSLQDLNLDGLSDIVGISKDGVRVALSDGQGGFQLEADRRAPLWYSLAAAEDRTWLERQRPRFFVDVNGDSLPDLIALRNDGVFVALQRGGRFAEFTKWGDFAATNNDAQSYRDQIRQIADVNSDGYPDLIGFFHAGVRVALNTGRSFGPSVPWLSALTAQTGWSESRSFRSSFDWNQDGYVDFIGMDPQKGFVVYLGNGRAFAESDLTSRSLSFRPRSLAGWIKVQMPLYFADMKNQGHLDIVILTRTGFVLLESEGLQPRLRESIDGRGKWSRVSYASLARPEVYQRQQEWRYPLKSMIANDHVVARLEEGGPSGEPKRLRYRYSDGAVHQAGLGFLGFQSWETFDEQAQSRTVTSYSFDYEKMLHGMPLRSMVYAGPTGAEVLLSETQNLWQSLALTNERHRLILPTEMITRNYSETGSLIATVRSLSQYDAYANLIKQSVITTDAGGQTYQTITDNTYDDRPEEWILGRISLARVSKQRPGQAPLSKTSAFSYDGDGLLKEEIVEPGTPEETRTIYSRSNNRYGLVGQTLARWQAKPGDGLPASEALSRSEFDAEGHTVAVVNPLGHSKRFVLDPNTAWVRDEIDANGLVQSVEYDERGSPVEITRFDGTKETITSRWCDESCPAGAVSLIISEASGVAPRTTYLDHEGREVRVETRDFKGRLIVKLQEYTRSGQPARVSEPFFAGDPVHWSVMGYDALDRLESTINPDGSRVAFRRDGLSEERIDARGHRSIHKTDVLGKLASVTNELGERIDYRYDSSDRLIEVRDPAGHRITLTYDRLDRRVSIDDPNTGRIETQYNGLNLPYLSEDNLGQLTRSRYDLLGRLIERRIEGEGQQKIDRWVYDGNSKTLGLLARVEGEGTIEELAYDSFNRLQEKTTRIDGRRFVETYRYDQLGRLSDQVMASGLALRFEYDEETSTLTRLQRVGKDRPYWTLSEANAKGQVEETILGNGLRSQFEYDPRNGRLQQQRVISPSLALIESRQYEYNEQGHVTRRVNLLNGQSESFSYDPLDRLEAIVNDKGDTKTLTYDTLGNIASRSDRGRYTYGQSCEGITPGPQAVTAVAGQTYCYNAKGQLLRGNSHRVQWSLYDLPEEISKGDNVVRFRYGPNGERFQTEILRGQDKTIITSLDGYEEIVDAEGLEQRHTLQGSLVVIMKNGREQEHFLHSDHLGSVTSITDDRGEVIERFDYDAWGHRRDLAGARELINYRPVSKHRFGFTGQEMLDAVDLVHMNGRVYDPAIGRFLSPDPFVQAPENLQSLNRYSYVWNNPLSHTDPSGYFLESIARGVGQLLGGVVGGVGDGLNGIGRAGQRFGSWISKPQNQRLVAALAISAVGGWGAAAALAQYGWIASAAVSGVSGFASGYVASNGDTNYALRSGLTAAAFNVVGSAFDANTQGIFASVKNASTYKTLAHGFVGGVSSVANGGNFFSGFATAGFSEALSAAGVYGDVKETLGVSSRWGTLAYETVAGSIVGGTTSELTGGTFENGAITAAMGRLFNEIGHARMAEKRMLREAGLDEEVVMSAALDAMSIAADAVGMLPGIVGVAGDSIGVMTYAAAGDWDSAISSLMAVAGNDGAKSQRYITLVNGPIFKTTKEAAEAATNLGFKRVAGGSKGEAIFSNGKVFITRDRDGHNGGAWKMGRTIKDLGRRETRMGTYDQQLNRIGD